MRKSLGGLLFRPSRDDTYNTRRILLARFPVKDASISAALASVLPEPVLCHNSMPRKLFHILSSCIMAR